MKLVKNNSYLLLIDEEAEIKKGDYILEKELIINIFPDYLTDLDECSKIIAYYPLTKEAKELDLPFLPNPFEEVDIGKLVNDKYPVSPQKRKIFIEGYKAAQSKQFSLEDMEKAIEMARDISDGNDTFTGGDITGLTEVCTYDWEQKYSDEEIIQSLSTQQSPKGFEPLIEIYDFDHGVGRSCIPRKILKTITNPEGKEELVGSYKY